MIELKLGKHLVGNLHPTFIIAEIGINHQGNIDIAKEMMIKAKECGADAVKFQKRTIKRILTKKGLEMPYENRNSFGKTYGEHKNKLELSNDDYRKLFNFSKDIEIEFTASGWDEESIDFLDDLGISFFKMASADLTNFPLLCHVAKKDKPIILSSGMADMDTVKAALDLVSESNQNLAVLQCTSTYPTKFSEINLNVITAYKNKFPNFVIGYSGHEQGIAIPVGAVSLGAKIIERHFTLDRTMRGGDHAASLEPQGFKKMVRDIRNLEEALGTDIKEMQDSEISVFKKLSKSIVSKIDIDMNIPISHDMLTTKGPGTGISPMHLEKIIGKTVKKMISADTVINKEDINW